MQTDREFPVDTRYCVSFHGQIPESSAYFLPAGTTLEEARQIAHRANGLLSIAYRTKTGHIHELLTLT